MLFSSSEQADDIRFALAKFKSAFITVTVFSGVMNLFMILPSIYMMQVYDRVLVSRSEMTLLMLSIMVVALYFIMSVIEWLRSIILIRVSAGIDSALSGRIFHACFSKSLVDVDTSPSQVFSDLSSIRQFMTGNGLFALLDIPWIPIYLLLTFLFNVTLGYFTVAGIVFILMLAVWNELSTRKDLVFANKSFNESLLNANQTLQNSEVIKALGMLNNLRDRWFQLQTRMLHHQMVASEKNSLLGSLTKFVRITWQSLVLGLGALLVLENQISGGMMIACSILLGRAFAPVELAVASWKQLSNIRLSYNRINSLLKQYGVSHKPMDLSAPKGAVKVENLNVFSPSIGRFVLRNIDFELSAGEILVVIGPSASGKSSLARALMGIWPAHSGAVRLDGANISHWDSERLGPHLGYLPQDVELFDGSIAQNIARFNTVDPEAVISAAVDAGIHEMILGFESGYDTLLKAGGTGLSGGQKQRIGLARAIYKTPSFIVLDEPNSNLDEAGDDALHKALLKMKYKSRTVVVVSHRPNVLSIADKVLVLDNGAMRYFGEQVKFIELVSKQRQ